MSRINPTFQSTGFAWIEQPKSPQHKQNKSQMSSILNHEERANQTPKRINPHRPIDQPKDSFYMQDNTKPQQKEKFIPTIKDQKLAPNYERRLKDNSSNIFYNNNRSPPPKFQEPANEMNFANKSINWSDVHYGRIKTDVNEKANFDHMYAKNQKMLEQRSQNMPCETERTIRCSDPHKEQDLINEPNVQIKQNNQQYSDIFGVGFGSPQRQKKSFKRSLSPSLQWDKFDSVIYQKDFLDAQNGAKSNQQNKSVFDTHNYENNTSQHMTKNTFDCKQSIDKIKGQYKASYQDFKDPEFGKEQKLGNFKSKYKGIYSWKRHYQK